MVCYGLLGRIHGDQLLFSVLLPSLDQHELAEAVETASRESSDIRVLVTSPKTKRGILGKG